MSINTLTLAHDFVARHVQPGDFCIDATAGRGRDTLFLCDLVGGHGHVLALDIQPQAVESTRKLLLQEGVADCAQVVLDSHSNVDTYAAPGSVDCIMFNFGWLPGGDHTVSTNPESSLPALEKALTLLRPGGVMSLCIYYGGDSGYAERDALLAYLPTIDSEVYTVIVGTFANRGGDPPIPVFIIKEA